MRRAHRAQHRDEPGVHLDRDDRGAGTGQRRGECPNARADLEDEVVRPGLGGGDDPLKDVPTDQEVLPPRGAEPQARCVERGPDAPAGGQIKIGKKRQIAQRGYRRALGVDRTYTLTGRRPNR